MFGVLSYQRFWERSMFHLPERWVWFLSFILPRYFCLVSVRSWLPELQVAEWFHSGWSLTLLKQWEKAVENAIQLIPSRRSSRQSLEDSKSSYRLCNVSCVSAQFVYYSLWALCVCVGVDVCVHMYTCRHIQICQNLSGVNFKLTHILYSIIWPLVFPLLNHLCDLVDFSRLFQVFVLIFHSIQEIDVITNKCNVCD